MMRNLNLTMEEEEEEEVEVSVREKKRQLLQQSLVCITILMGVSGGAALASGVCAYNEMRVVERVGTVTIFSVVSILLMLCGTAVLLGAVFIPCFERPLCVLTYSVTIVFVLQCIGAALAITWKEELHKFLEEDLQKLLTEGKMDDIQSTFGCCGMLNIEDWRVPPQSCCRKAPCPSSGPHHEQGCLRVVKGRYEVHFSVMGYLSLSVAIFQLACYNLANYIVMRME